MKRLMTLGSLLFASALVVSGCGNVGEDADTDNREEADIITNQEKEGGDIETGDGYGFTELNLEIEVDGDDAIDVDYKVEEDFDPEYQNALTNIDLEGDDAMDELDKMFKTVNFESNMSEEEARDKILEFYQIAEYSDFKLNVHFDDDTDLTYKDEQ